MTTKMDTPKSDRIDTETSDKSHSIAFFRDNAKPTP